MAQPMHREIVLDTETTGLDPANGDRIVEIGCIELIGHVPTGRSFHAYIDPERRMSAEATQITGITDEQLAGKPKFFEIADQFLTFIADTPLVIHNAVFDLKFLNFELGKAGKGDLRRQRIVDTLDIARQRFPGAQNNLDALCKRFQITHFARDKHGALLDAEILAHVYLELIGGRQQNFDLNASAANRATQAMLTAPRKRFERSVPLQPRLTEAEREAHDAFVAKLGESALWRQFNAS